MKIPICSADAPTFSIGYNEFNQSAGPSGHFYGSTVFCGVGPFPYMDGGAGKQMFEIGTGKLAGNFSPLRAQQIYDCR